VPGSHENLKVTTAFDLLVAEALITRTRRGPAGGVPRSTGAQGGAPVNRTRRPT
jgi:hypothetical protein